MALQMDKCCSFNLPIHNVVFVRLREVDPGADDASCADIQACRKSKQWRVAKADSIMALTARSRLDILRNRS